MPYVALQLGTLDLHEIALGIADELPRIVAEALTCDDEGGSLEPEHVEVRILNPTLNDKNVKDLSITIEANDFPSRRANLGERQLKITSEIRSNLQNVDFSQKYAIGIWVKLFPASYSEFEVG